MRAGTHREQVAAFVALGRRCGFEMKAGRVAAIVKRHGHGQKVVDALTAALAHRALEVHDYIEGVLRNGRNGRPGRVSPGESARRLVERQRRAWEFDAEPWERYAAGEDV